VRGDPEALEALEKVIKLDPHHAEALTWAAFVYLTLGKPEQAAAILKPVLERHPRNYRAAAYLSAACELLGRSDELERSLRQSGAAVQKELKAPQVVSPVLLEPETEVPESVPFAVGIPPRLYF
jgi:predicted Zn-dependent protease